VKKRSYPGKIRVYSNCWNDKERRFEPGDVIREAECFVTEEGAEVRVEVIGQLLVEKGSYWVSWAGIDKDTEAVRWDSLAKTNIRELKLCYGKNVTKEERSKHDKRRDQRDEAGEGVEPSGI